MENTCATPGSAHESAETPMTRWLVTQNNSQFAVEDLAELKQLATSGKVTAGDMVQPPGATEWLYASEIPELAGILDAGADDDVFETRKSGMGSVLLGVVLVVVIIAGGAGMWVFGQQLPTGYESMMDQMKYSEMLVTEPDAPLRSAPEASASTVVALAKDAKLELLAKRGSVPRESRRDVLLKRLVRVRQLGEGILGENLGEMAVAARVVDAQVQRGDGFQQRHRVVPHRRRGMHQLVQHERDELGGRAARRRGQL